MHFSAGYTYVHVVDGVWDGGRSGGDAARCSDAQSDGRDDDGRSKRDGNQCQSCDGRGSPHRGGRSSRDVRDFSAVVEVAEVVGDAI